MVGEVQVVDKSKLGVASANPWFILMNFYGEQSDKNSRDKNTEIYEKNCALWNRWALSVLIEKNADLNILGEKYKALNKDPDIIPMSKEELDDLYKKLNERSSKAISNRAPATIETNLKFIDMSNLYVQSDLVINNYIFPMKIEAIGCVFEKNLFAQNCIFFDVLNISNTEFCRALFLQGSYFKSNFMADEIVCRSNANFSRAQFARTSYFNNGKYYFEADWRKSKFLKDVDFKKNVFFGEVDFESAYFYDSSRFNNSSFENLTRFADSAFLTSPPFFHGSKLHEGTEWHRVQWPKAPTDPYQGQLHVYAYERLKQEMERLKKQDDELNFFEFEMRARRVTEGLWSGRGILNASYDWFSGYGRSIEKPTIALLLIIFFTTLPIAIWMGGVRDDWLGLRKFRKALELTLANITAPLNTRKDFLDPNMLESLPTWIKYLSGFQTLSGLLCAFLIGLALRNRFRLK
jgi:uncharacterized protein YjbI with pentapeptide repeats